MSLTRSPSPACHAPSAAAGWTRPWRRWGWRRSPTPARVLSGGEQQRLALARAWALEPKVLFLDEPTANLDPAATRAIEAVIAAMGADGVKIVMTTHDLGQARRQADEIVFLHKGRLIEHAPAARFFARPGTPEARAFVAGELLA
jgi:tungstate transport system ATP-binding protein